MRVLVVKISSMGDVIHTLPALTDAMYAMPEICFDWAVEEDFSQIPTWHPGVRQVIPVAIRRWKKNWFSLNVRQERFHFKQRLQHEDYDIIIDAQGLIKTAILITRIARGESHGLDYKSAREPFASLFYHRKHRIGKQQHAVERVRKLFAESLNYPFSRKFGNYSISNYFHFSYKKKPYLVFLHSASQSRKLWPEAHWKKLIYLINDIGYQIRLPWKTKEEYFRSKRFAKESPNMMEVLPPLTLEELAAQLKDAIAIVSVDTGLSHLAAALDKPNLTLFGPTDSVLVGGYGRYQSVIQAKDKNMESITAEYVWKRLQIMLLKQ
ncbi:lipopolysaccharide heptosyltransferase RfaC [Sodalis sp. CWE]|uniref:lipopolysaccharide heptosyltransferase RfaC n=1 Tax=Sodalis sp. CWE TaxID=2803816 RepID=UPI001C7CB011|nr:lipopolysaccharide heptosyltransferase RfaC [Sodalis sp. CWE]MBX4180960.1 lipopolysaccharide heptosyltransferase RfaC [Sodalis sp. CWE]